LRTSAKIALGVAVAGMGTCGVAAFSIIQRGVSARDEPTAVEASLARLMRRLAMPRAERARPNPVPLTPQALASGRAHFADHCASCHGNDGKGETPIGRGLYPKAPDMTKADTQSLTDGEIFYVIRNGIRLTGMPAWGDGTPAEDGETWQLVHFIRSLPRLTPEEIEEMRALNPRTRQEWEEEEAARRFLEGEEPAPAPAPKASPHRH
jgi:mono/diheme cytochrome c family protein